MRVLKLAQSWTTMKVLPADTNPCIICYIANTFHILHHLHVQPQGAVEHHHLDIGRPGQPHLHPAYRHLHLRHPGHAGETLLQNNNLPTQKPLLMPLPAVREGLHDKELSPLPNYTNNNNIIIITIVSCLGRTTRRKTSTPTRFQGEETKTMIKHKNNSPVMFFTENHSK